MTRTSGSGMIWLFLLILVASAMLMLTMAFKSGNLMSIAVPNNQVSEHGLTKHPEAKAIQDSCNKDVYQIWRAKFERKYFYICQIEEGKWGIIPVVVSGGQQIWKTAFSPGNGSWNDILRYLGNIATRFTGTVQ